MYKRLNNFVEKNNILSSEHQYGFRKNRSTELAIIEFIDKITKAIEKDNIQLVFSSTYQKHLILLITAS